MRTVLLSVLISVMQTISIAQTEVVSSISESKDNYTVIDLFTVTCNEKIWDIKWKAISEINNCTYAIEYSIDQTNWIEFKAFDGTAQTIGVYTYSTFMKRTSDSVHYFRLRYDATSTQVFYKNPVANLCPEYVPETTSGGTTFIVDYSNTTNSINIGCNGSLNSKSKIQIYSSIGQLVYNEEVLINDQSGKINIPFTGYSKDIFIVKISNGSNVSTKKIYIP